MGFQDIFKSNFLTNVTSVSMLDMILAMALAFAIGLFIFTIYKKTFTGVMYSSNFGVTLIALTLVSTFVILAVTSNVVLSLGMVGALSLVRFRTAIKDPLDIAFLFWAIGAGIVIAAGMLPLAVFGSVVIGVILLVFCNRESYDSPYIMVVTCDGDAAEKDVTNQLASMTRKMVVKSKTVTKNCCELNYEIRLKDNSTDFVNKIANTAGVQNAVLVSYNGDYMN